MDHGLRPMIRGVIIMTVATREVAVAKAPCLLAVRQIPGDSHGGTFRENNGGAFGVAAVAWLDWWTKGDEEAGKMFLGDKSGLEKDPGWVEVRRKNLR